MNVQLTNTPPNDFWNSSALYSIEAGMVQIHLGDCHDPLEVIQKAGRQLANQGLKQPRLTGSDWTLAYQQAFAQGYYSPKVRQAPEWAGHDADMARQLSDWFSAHDWVRAQMNASPEALSPANLVRAAASFLSSASDAISYEFIEGEALSQRGFVGTWQVGRGSARPPAALILDYNPGGSEDTPVHAALVGKGITFDSGGYSMKTSEGMLSMKMDMGGAAFVTGALWLAIRQGLNKRTQLILCCAENLVSGHAYKLGDIIEYPSGLSVEIVNTDAEGRLVLADGLWHASKANPNLLIDAATLTGAAHIAVGNEYNAVFSMDSEVLARTLAQADKQSEPHWPLPLTPKHRNKFPSAYADVANSVAVKGGGAGGASNAAGFLSRFVRDDAKGWLHIDLAGGMMSKETSQWSAGGTAMGIRTIAGLLNE